MTPLNDRHKPQWLKIKPNFGPVYTEVKSLLQDLNLHTVCQEAGCPNIGECFSARTATFLILGDRCTRNCRFCDVQSDNPLPPDCLEPERVALAVRKLGLKFAVVTSVTRDDLPDGGAGVFAAVINAIRRSSPACGVEVLIPDFKGDSRALDMVLAARPEVIAHNIETVPELYCRVRPQADYRRSLELLRRCGESSKGVVTKSGMMIGLGESVEMIEKVLADIAAVGCQIFTIGQYLSPSKNHLPVEKYYHPDEFAEFAEFGRRCGIPHVESAPLVRSSYLAHRQFESLGQAIRHGQ